MLSPVNAKNQHTKLQVSEETRNKILKDHIQKGFVKDVEEGLRDRHCYNKSGKAFETLSKIFIAFGGILSFSSGYYNNAHLGFAAGSISTISLACLQFSSFCYKESQKNQDNVNAILMELNIQNLPDQTFQNHSEHSDPVPTQSRRPSFNNQQRRASYPVQPQPEEFQDELD